MSKRSKKQTNTSHSKELTMPAAINNQAANAANDLAYTLTKACEEMKAMTESYVSAAAKSNAAAMQGFEDLTRNMGAMFQDGFTRALNCASTLAAVKSPQEAAEMHANFLKDSFDQMVAGGSKLSEISIRTAQSAIDPLAQHANDAVGNLMTKAKSAA